VTVNGKLEGVIMDFSALVLSVEATRRYARSALPDAEIRPDRHRWRHLSAAVRRATRPREPEPGHRCS
jgi:hypothetical protein